MPDEGTAIDILLTVSPAEHASKVARDISDRKGMERTRAALLAREQEARATAEDANRRG